MLAAAACGKDHAGAAKSDEPVHAAPLSEGLMACEQLAFAPSTPLPEASGAAWVVLDGKSQLVAIGDSGNGGAYAVIDPDTGDTLEQGKLPLGDASDDLEGLAARGDLLYGLTSAGWMRAWRRDGKAWRLVDGPYAIGPVDDHMPRQHPLREKPPGGDAIACPAREQNCGHDFEGLAIVDAAHARGPCAGFALAKADGVLMCLVEKEGRFAVDRARTLAVGRPGALADVAFADDGSLWLGGNIFDLSRVYRVDGWDDLAHAKVVAIGELGGGNPEVVAVRGDTIYRMSDTNGSPSGMAKFRCRAAKQ